MKTTSFTIAILSILILTYSCKKGNRIRPLPGTPTVKMDYLMFGHYYGMCVGEECVEIFQLDNKELLEDTKDEYPTLGKYYQGNFVKLDDSKFNLVYDLEKYIPDSLFFYGDSTYGCPDCADQGGMYIEYKKGNVHRRWLIDQNQLSTPKFIHDFQDRVNDGIRKINQK